MLWVPECLTLSQTVSGKNKCWPIPLSSDMMRERLRWLGHVLWMKYDRFAKIVHVGQASRAKRKLDHPKWDEDVHF